MTLLSTHITNSTSAHQNENENSSINISTIPEINSQDSPPSPSFTHHSSEGELHNIINHITSHPTPIYSTSSHFTNSTFASTFLSPTNISNSPRSHHSDHGSRHPQQQSRNHSNTNHSHHLRPHHHLQPHFLSSHIQHLRIITPALHQIIIPTFFKYSYIFLKNCSNSINNI